VGCTSNIDKRLLAHNTGKSQYTSKYKPWEIIYTEEVENYTKARKRERYFKSGAGRKFISTLFDKL
jgi:putative endonuclease